MFGLKEFKSLRLIKAAAALGMVFNDEVDKRLANDHTYLNGFTWLLSYLTTTALEDGNIRWPLEHQIPGEWIRDYLFNVLERDVVAMGDNCLGKFRCEYFAMIMIGQPLLSIGS